MLKDVKINLQIYRGFAILSETNVLTLRKEETLGNVCSGVCSISFCIETI